MKAIIYLEEMFHVTLQSISTVSSLYKQCLFIMFCLFIKCKHVHMYSVWICYAVCYNFTCVLNFYFWLELNCLYAKKRQILMWFYREFSLARSRFSPFLCVLYRKFSPRIHTEKWHKKRDFQYKFIYIFISYTFSIWVISRLCQARETTQMCFVSRLSLFFIQFTMRTNCSMTTHETHDRKI